MILCGDALEELKKMDSGIVQTCITSPPYWNLRDYGVDGQIGLEPTPEEYIVNLVEVFRAVRRVLRDDGTLWLVLGDCYAATGKSGGGTQGKRWEEYGADTCGPRGGKWSPAPPSLKPKDLCMIPARVALALQTDGWWLRSDIIWAKPNSMPESVTDRPTSAHEHIFLLAKGQRYFYDADAIREPHQTNDDLRGDGSSYSWKPTLARANHFTHPNAGRNKRNVWTVATKPYPEAHFAVYPPALIEPCVLAGSAEGDTILDLFMGSGTTGEVALKHRRKFIGIELNPEYVKLAEKRLREVEVVMFRTPTSHRRG